MTTPNDTTTTLNTGVNGDKIDESLITQVSGVIAKRPRVALGGDDGSLVSLGADGNGNTAITIEDTQSLKILPLMFRELRRLNLQMRILLSELTARGPHTDDELDAMDTHMDRE